MRVLRVGARGHDVERWQMFLIGQGLEPGIADGIFGNDTFHATVAFQAAHALVPDGVVGNRTLGQAMLFGFEALLDGGDDGDFGPSWPKPPAFPPLVGTLERQRVFGAFEFVAAPIAGNPENIRILGDWVRQNIVAVEIPQLEGVGGGPGGAHKVSFHRLGAPQLQALFAAWEAAGLRERVLTWAGSFAPRFVRGSTTLSNHAFGSAFDVNAAWNAFGTQPALLGAKGCVRELVEIANDYGFYWGGHFTTRSDGMHFELAEILDPATVTPRPPRPPVAPGAVTGTSFLRETQAMGRGEREAAIFTAIANGDVPSWATTFTDVTVQSGAHEGRVRVAVDYAAIGTDDDFLRIPMSPLTAQRLADRLGYVLPTKALVDAIHQAAALKLAPQPLSASPQMMSNAYYAEHQRIVELQRGGRGTGELTAGHKKDVVVTNRLQWKPRRLAIYGWHQPNGAVIQPLSTIHEDTYADYSHGIRWVDETMVVDGETRRVADVLASRELAGLLSDEGVIAQPRYAGV